MSKNSTDIRLLVRIDHDNSFGDHALKFTGYIQIMVDGKPESPDSYRTDDRRPELDGLTITAQLTPAYGNEFYGWEVSYREPYRVDLDRAESMVKVLRTIRRVMDRTSERFGQPADLAAFAAYAIATFANADHPFLLRVPPERDFSGTGYRAMDADSLRWFIRDETAKWRKQYSPEDA
jgi:hypothetical protein